MINTVNRADTEIWKLVKLKTILKNNKSEKPLLQGL
jgi:hypothetical protein